MNPLTASDYAGMLFYVKNAEAINSGKISDLTQLGAKSVDPQTVRVELTGPTPFFLELCAFWTPAVVPQTIEQHGDQWCLSKPSWSVARTRSTLARARPGSAAETNNAGMPPTQKTTSSIFSRWIPPPLRSTYSRPVRRMIWDKSLVPTELLDALSTRSSFHKFDYLGSYFLRFNTTKTAR